MTFSWNLQNQKYRNEVMGDGARKVMGDGTRKRRRKQLDATEIVSVTSVSGGYHVCIRLATGHTVDSKVSELKKSLSCAMNQEIDNRIAQLRAAAPAKKRAAVRQAMQTARLDLARRAAEQKAD